MSFLGGYIVGSLVTAVGAIVIFIAAWREESDRRAAAERSDSMPETPVPSPSGATES